MYPQRSVMTCGLATALEPPHFNHAPVRGAIGAIQYVAGYVTKFQSTHPRGVRRPSGPYPGCDRRFQSTHPRGVRRRWRCLPLACRNRFNPRTRVGCDQRGVRCPQGGWPCFNPRTRVGCDRGKNPVSGRGRDVSIHAPGGVRRPVAVVHAGRCAVSIHAPAWGATGIGGATLPLQISFNPRTRVGCDVTTAFSMHPVSMFQSTHPRGVRLQENHAFPHGMICFNPRTRVGCDRAAQCKSAPAPVSIHAPAWGATHALSHGAVLAAPFQSTHPRGVRRPTTS